MTQLAGKVAVVVGGSGGIGAEICAYLARAGATVVLTYRKGREAAERVQAGLPGVGHWAKQLSVDDSAGLKLLAAEVESRHGRCDILVNCAGITRFVPHADLDALDDQLIDDIFRTNWRGAFAAVRAFRPLLQATQAGLVINISSIGDQAHLPPFPCRSCSFTVSRGRPLPIEGDPGQRSSPLVIGTARESPTLRTRPHDDPADLIAVEPPPV